MKHKHAEVLHAFVDGIECQALDFTQKKWHDIKDLTDFTWADAVRIKPQSIIREEYLVFWKQGCWNSFQSQQSFESNPKQFKLTYKDENLEKVEIVK